MERHDQQAMAASAEVAAAQHGAFTATQAIGCGISRHVLRRLVTDRVLREPAPGVLVSAFSAPTWHQEMMVATLAGGGRWAAGRAAAHLHGFDGFDRPPPLEVAVAHGRKGAAAGVRVHRFSRIVASDHHPVRNIPTLNVATTLAHLGAVASDDEVELALDSAIRMGYSEEWIRATHERQHRPGPTGTASLARVLGLARRHHAPASVLEAAVARLLEDPRIPDFVQHHRAVGADGKEYELDFAWPGQRIALEGHSLAFHSGPRTGDANSTRHLALMAAGWQVAYATAAMCEEPALLVDLVAALFADAA